MASSGPGEEASLTHRERPSAGEPEGALILLHGRGADEHDLFGLLDILDPDRRLVGLCPRGPLSLPPGGAHWYAVHRVGHPDPTTFWPTFRTTARWLDAALGDRGIPAESAVLGGFSQGAVMSYALAFAPGRPAPAALVALSGFMPAVEGLELDLAHREGFPVAVGHGTHDPVIGVDFGRAARDRLTAAGVDLTYAESPMAHSIDPGFLARLVPWLGRVVDGFGSSAT